MNSVNLLLASAGRRPYLVRWFKEAVIELGINGRIIVADNDKHSPSQRDADVFEVAPRVADPSYEEWLAGILRDYEISLALSINDFELSRWASVIPSEARFSPLIRLSAASQRAVEDKLAMAQLLGASGISTPRTLLASDPQLHAAPLHELENGIVIKGRYGSGSRGLNIVKPEQLEKGLLRASHEVTHESGRPAADALEARQLTVIQQKITGQEYGLDVVADPRGDFVCVLARQKIAMRGGETDRAISVDPEPFVDLGRRITQAVGHRGLIDVDIICDEDDNPWVIDINPRFGGGYPFSHMAGAHIPKAYVAWAAGKVPEREWLQSAPGVVSAKSVETTIVDLLNARC